MHADGEGRRRPSPPAPDILDRQRARRRMAHRSRTRKPGHGYGTACGAYSHGGPRGRPRGGRSLGSADRAPSSPEQTRANPSQAAGRPEVITHRVCTGRSGVAACVASCHPGRAGRGGNARQRPTTPWVRIAVSTRPPGSHGKSAAIHARKRASRGPRGCSGNLLRSALFKAPARQHSRVRSFAISDRPAGV